MTNEEKVRLVLETLGVDNVKAATKAMKDLASGIDETYDAMDDLSYFAKELGSSIRQGVEQPMEQVAYSIDKSGKIIRNAAENATGKSGADGRGILQMSWALQDLVQGGFPAILNNVDGIARAFGIAAGTAGTLAMAFLAVDQAVKILGPLFESTDKPLKKLSETFDDFFDGVGKGKVDLEKLSNEMKKTAESIGTGFFESIDSVIKKLDELADKQREAKQLNEELSQESADRKKGAELVNELAGKDAEKGGMFNEFFKGQLDSGRTGILAKMAKDRTQKAFNELVDEQVAELERAGLKGELQIGLARLNITEALKKNPAAVQRRAEEIAAGDISKGTRGDKTALDNLRANIPEFDEFLKETEADTKFEQGNARAASRSAARRREEAEVGRRQNAIGPNREMFNRAQDAEAWENLRKAQAIGPNRDIADQLQQNKLLNDRKTEQAEFLQGQQQQAGVRNQALGMIDPLQAAIMRRQQAGIGGMSKRNLQALEQRDIRNFQNLLMQGGMGRGEAEQAAMESLRGGEASFQDMARGLGFSLDTVADGFRASVAVMQQLNQQIQRVDGENQALRQQLQMMGNGDNRAPARPQLRRRLNN